MIKCPDCDLHFIDEGVRRERLYISDRECMECLKGKLLVQNQINSELRTENYDAWCETERLEAEVERLKSKLEYAEKFIKSHEIELKISHWCRREYEELINKIFKERHVNDTAENWLKNKEMILDEAPLKSRDELEEQLQFAENTIKTTKEHMDQYVTENMALECNAWHCNCAVQTLNKYPEVKDGD